MIRAIALCALVIAALSLSGCDEQLVGIELATSPDLRVKVQDDYRDGPYENALVTVYLPEGRTDSSHTGSDGWTTQWLLIPRSDRQVKISVSYEDDRGNPHTIYRWIPLERGDTEYVFVINTYAP